MMEWEPECRGIRQYFGETYCAHPYPLKCWLLPPILHGVQTPINILISKQSSFLFPVEYRSSQCWLILYTMWKNGSPHMTNSHTMAIFHTFNFGCIQKELWFAVYISQLVKMCYDFYDREKRDCLVSSVANSWLRELTRIQQTVCAIKNTKLYSFIINDHYHEHPCHLYYPHNFVTQCNKTPNLIFSYFLLG
jgi:hypothetical protein